MAKSAAKEWADGVPLWEAIRLHAPRKLSDEYETLRSAYFSPIAEDLVQIPPRPHPRLPENPQKVWDKDLNRIAELEKQLKDWALDALKSGVLSATGLPRPRLQHARPERIQLDHWHNGKFSWKLLELFVGGATYEQLKFVRASKKVRIDSSGQSRTGRGRGRPLAPTAEVLEAWRELEAQGLIPKSSPRNRTFKLVKQKACELHPEIAETISGLSDSFLYGVLKDLFDAQRGTGKIP